MIFSPSPSIPIADGPRWGRIDGPGLGVEVDEDKVGKYHADYRKHGEFPTYVGKVAAADSMSGQKRQSRLVTRGKRR